MKFTLNWLKDHLETEATLDEIVEALTDLGLEVEEVVNPADRLGTFRIGYVKSAEQHPNADRLRVCMVETAAGMQQIICGAPNARAGIKVVVAQPGDYVPGIDTTIQVGEIRGVESHGMMASERELELSDEHDGIIELPEAAEVGQRYIDFAELNDPMIEIAITPNRPDALGVRGIARDLAARGLGTLKSGDVPLVEGAYANPITTHLAADVADKACPVFFGRHVRGVKNGPSPKWMQQRLIAIGLRPISTLVDITNYVTYDRGRPLHVFDADKVHGDLTVRFAKEGETITALDDKEYTLTPEMTIIADEQGVESIGGIMGGAASGCTDETVNVYIEAAYFDPVRTAHTGRALKINSDARYRFERGVDPAFTPDGVELATRLVLDLCGGEPSEVTKAGEVPDTARRYDLDPARVISLVGMDIPRTEQVRILEALGFDCAQPGIVTSTLAAVAGTAPVAESGVISVGIPSWRPDVHGEADLVEEVARVASLTKLEGKPMPREAGIGEPVLSPMQVRTATARRSLAALGLNECVTYSFIQQSSAALFGGGSDATEVANPISSEMSHMRPDLLPGLMEAATRNQARGIADLGLFEVGMAFEGGEPEEDALHATGLRVGHTAPRNAHGTRRPVDLYDAKADAEALLSTLGAPVERLMPLRTAPAWFHPGRSGVLGLGPKNPLAVFGELHPKVVEALDLKGPVVGFTVFPANIPFPKAKTATRAPLALSDLQSVERDFAFVVDADVEADKLLRAAKGADKQLIEAVSLFDVYQGPRVEEGKKSLAIAARLQPKDATLTDDQIEAVAAKIIKAVEKATGGVLRG
ncbi:phenylalanine--tRNA ligase subunit beta [Pontivivens insulae]|uniref:Phenylalanine--tRNA ligase beta subunit n=1 Tax=Pontivivens insulae TaxID=1639689 RepID=A0A2R8A969_9RHOB|nr:phenylalanine--tRNA ligase subunit beta [Pontivivens insulae]RED12686.1 phenylalanyl-tRNA synthetase beta subunit [Pontivivens insulae]SPF28777.1 Phenylalanine--tRNA ligase beta subunit [Pontivivens insulae]